MNKILITNLPEVNGEIKGCWYNGYPIHKGLSDNSLNQATVYANENKIIPNQERLKSDFENFKKTLRDAGFDVIEMPFPKELNEINRLNHDAVFVRDSGMMFKDYWIKANFSAKNRQPEAEAYAKIMTDKFNKKVIEVPFDAFIEFGEVIYIKTKDEDIYFGGLSRANKKGHDFVRDIIKPDKYCLIESKGYHLDTVFSPVLNKDNELVAFIVAKDLVSQKSIDTLKEFGVDVILVEDVDSSGSEGELGNYAVNTLIAPGVIVSSSRFETPGVENKLELLGVEHFVCPLTDFRFAGGSVHCLTNDIYE